MIFLLELLEKNYNILDIIELRERGVGTAIFGHYAFGKAKGFGCELPLTPPPPQTWNAKAHNFCTFLFRRWVHKSHVNLH